MSILSPLAGPNTEYVEEKISPFLGLPRSVYSKLAGERPFCTPTMLGYTNLLSIIAGTSTALIVALSPAHNDGVTLWKQLSMDAWCREYKDGGSGPGLCSVKETVDLLSLCPATVSTWSSFWKSGPNP